MSSPQKSGSMFRLTDNKTEEEMKALHPNFPRITEGHATVFFAPPKHQQQQDQEQKQKQKQGTNNNNNDDDATKGDISVFYNPPQVVNRDLSVCMLQVISNMRKTEAPRRGGTGENGITVLEALSASGLRAIRYWHEVSGIRSIVANDLDADAVDCIRRNVESNQIPVIRPGQLTLAEETLRQVRHRKFASNPEEENKKRAEAIQQSTGIVPNRDDAIVLMQRAGWDPKLYPVGEYISGKTSEPLLHSQLFDVVDLDPYGTVGPFLDSTMDSCKEGALICATSTDSSILCGNFPETSLAKYASCGIKTEACHEMAPRIVLAALERAANRRGKYIQPLLSLHIDFYVRVFVRVYTQPADVKLAMCKFGYQVQCARCPQYHLHPVGHVPETRLKGRPTKMFDEKKDADADVDKKEQQQEDAAQQEEKEKEVADVGSDSNNNTNNSKNNFKSMSYPQPPDRKANPKQSLSNFHTDAWSDHAPEEKGTCVCCGSRLLIGGPLYCGPTQNKEFLNTLLQEIERRGEKELKGFSRVRGLVLTAQEELEDVPLFTTLGRISSEMKMCCPPAEEITRALNRLGYRVSSAHCDSSALKTDAPMKLILSILAQYKKMYGAQGPANPDHVQDRDVPEKFRNFIEPFEAANFGKFSAEEKKEIHEKLNLVQKKNKLPRFVPNAPNWGPRARHTGAAANNNNGAESAGQRREREEEKE